MTLLPQRTGKYTQQQGKHFMDIIKAQMYLMTLISLEYRNRVQISHEPVTRQWMWCILPPEPRHHHPPTATADGQPLNDDITWRRSGRDVNYVTEPGSNNPERAEPLYPSATENRSL